MTDPKVTQDSTEASEALATELLATAFSSAMASRNEDRVPSFKQALEWAGYVLWADERGVDSDLWEAWDRLHIHLGHGSMRWDGALLISERCVDVCEVVSYLLRGVGADDWTAHVANADKAMRRKRLTALRNMEQDAALLAKVIQTHEADQTTNGTTGPVRATCATDSDAHDDPERTSVVGSALMDGIRTPLPNPNEGPGAGAEIALELPREQRLSLTIYRDGTFSIEELMPPLLNYGRLLMPTAQDEAEMRQQEWKELRMR